MNIVNESVGTGKYIIEGSAAFLGRDINISIGGGESYHIGAISLAVPENETINGKKRSAATSVICIQGHKEDEFAHYAAKYLATALHCVVAVSVGVHIDNISMDEIETLRANFTELVKKLEASLQKSLKQP